MHMSLIRGGADGGQQQPMAGWLEGDPMYADKQLVIRHTIPPNGLSFSGVLDIFNADLMPAMRKGSRTRLMMIVRIAMAQPQLCAM